MPCYPGLMQHDLVADSKIVAPGASSFFVKEEASGEPHDYGASPTVASKNAREPSASIVRTDSSSFQSRWLAG
ncbi:MAG: hypothetical protein JWP89_3564 [Schlesneria sp.]|nr:hypothetical protein [Schlesneria sp.]